MEKAVFLGERDRILSFLSFFLNEEKKELFKSFYSRSDLQNDCKIDINSISAVYSETYDFKTDNEKLICSPDVPMGYKITFREYEGSDPNVIEEIKKLNPGCLFFLFSFRFERMMSVFSKLKQDLRKGDTYFFRIKAVVFDDPDLHTSSTDINSPEEEFSNAVIKIQNEINENNLSDLIKVSEFRDKSDMYSVFSGGDGSLCFSGKLIYELFENVKNNIESFKKDKWSFIHFKMLEIVTKEFKAAITDYRSVSRATNLFSSYINEFFNRDDFWKTLSEQLELKYKDIFKKIAFWDLDKDFEKIMGQVYEKSKRFMLNRDYPVVNITRQCSSSDDYKILCSKMKYDTLFAKDIDILLNTEICNYFYEEIKNRAMKLYKSY